jgi:mono/diheme cytochrome c family protein
MSGHFAASLEIKDAVILGDLVGVRAPALRLDEGSDSFPTAWRPYVTVNRQLAAAARDAADLQGAARVAAELANTCGECHVATGHGPRFSPGRPPRWRRRRGADGA